MRPADECRTLTLMVAQYDGCSCLEPTSQLNARNNDAMTCWRLTITIDDAMMSMAKVALVVVGRVWCGGQAGQNCWLPNGCLRACSYSYVGLGLASYVLGLASS